ncbi:MAG: hypothetical protein O2921_05490 [Chloroflexi bacterium]|nr:hypothetical protein [Chloroflexota bacterium]MDA1282063.1 hypothetical protein [Chloroflexota bacterium]
MTRRIEYDRIDENFILFVMPVGQDSGHTGAEVGQTSKVEHCLLYELTI